MTDEKPQIRSSTAARGDEARQERLKSKLRENLKRRKSQLKERSRGAGALSEETEASPDGEVGKAGG
jgi:hypothetical protein